MRLFNGLIANTLTSMDSTRHIYAVGGGCADGSAGYNTGTGTGLLGRDGHGLKTNAQTA